MSSFAFRARHWATLGLCLLATSGWAAPPDVLLETEPNDKRNSAQRLPTGGLFTAVAGAIAKRQDVDLYRIDLNLGECVGIALTPNPLADLDLELLSSLGLVLARSDQRGGCQIETLATCGLPLSQTYYLRVLRFSGKTGAIAGSYGLELAPASAR